MARLTPQQLRALMAQQQTQANPATAPAQTAPQSALPAPGTAPVVASGSSNAQAQIAQNTAQAQTTPAAPAQATPAPAPAYSTAAGYKTAAKKHITNTIVFVIILIVLFFLGSIFTDQAGVEKLSAETRKLFSTLAAICNFGKLFAVLAIVWNGFKAFYASKCRLQAKVLANSNASEAEKQSAQQKLAKNDAIYAALSFKKTGTANSGAAMIGRILPTVIIFLVAFILKTIGKTKASSMFWVVTTKIAGLVLIIATILLVYFVIILFMRSLQEKAEAKLATQQNLTTEERERYSARAESIRDILDVFPFAK